MYLSNEETKNKETRDGRNTRHSLPLTPTLPHRTGLVEDMATNDKLLIQSLRVSNEVEGNENTRPMNQLERRIKEGRLVAVSIILEITNGKLCRVLGASSGTFPHLGDDARRPHSRRSEEDHRRLILLGFETETTSDHISITRDEARDRPPNDAASERAGLRLAFVRKVVLLSSTSLPSSLRR